MIRFVKLVLVSLLPGIELRGSIPFGIAMGMNPALVVMISIASNIVLVPVFFAILNSFWHWVEHWEIVKRYVKSLRERANPYVDKYGSYGIFFFVAVPLPGSGVYTGVLVAWLLGMDKSESIVPISLGVLTAATLITAFSLGTVAVLGF